MNLSLEKLLATCKRENPARLLAYLGNDEQRAISVKGGRKRWANTVNTVAALAGWTRVELLDKAGALLATVDNTDPAGELQDLTPGRGGAWDQVERGMAIMQRGIDAALRAQNEQMRGVLAAQENITNAAVRALQTLTQLHEAQLQTVRETEEQRTEAAIAAAAGQDGISQLIEALPALLQVASMAKTMLNPGTVNTDGARAANGVNTKRGS